MDRNVVRPEKKVLLDGPYGRANLGDNAIAWCMANFLRRQGLEVEVSCIDPDYVASSLGLTALPMLDYKRLKTSVLNEVGRYDAVVIGGGQQLQEHRMPNPFFGMLPRVCSMAKAANQRGIPFFAWAIGMDWPISPIGQRMIRTHLGNENVTLIFRDRASFDNAKSLLVGRQCRIHHGKDAAFMIDDLLRTDGSTNLRVSTERTLLISPSMIQGSGRYLEKIIEVGRAAAEAGYVVRGWHSDIRTSYDQAVRHTADWNVIPGFQWLPAEAIGTRSVAQILCSASIVLTTRMHPAIIAASMNVSAYGIATNDKMRSVFGEMGLPHTDISDIDTLSFQQILQSDYAVSFSRSAAFGREAEISGRYLADLIKRSSGHISPNFSASRPWANH